MALPTPIRSTPVEIFIGRSLAACAHPFAAWRAGTMLWRVQCVTGYFVASYVGVLLALLVLARAS